MNAIVASVLAIGLILSTFSLFEPVVAHGVDSTAFSVTQEIASEISFLSQPTDVTMAGGAISGITGGVRFGTSTFNITTNDPDGYTISIAFASSTAMEGENINSDIPNFIPDADPQPDFDFTVGAGEAWFAYTVNNVTTPADIDTTFRDNGAACNVDTNSTVGKCWFNKSDASVSEQIIDASAATAGTGATSTVVFQVGVGGNPSPALETGFYTATATLTAVVK